MIEKVKNYNYHDNSKKIEEELEDELLIIILYLLGKLKSITNLTESSIEMIVAAFYIKYDDKIEKISKKNIEDITKLVEDLIKDIPENEDKTKNPKTLPKEDEKQNTKEAVYRIDKDGRPRLDRTKVIDQNIVDKYVNVEKGFVTLIVESIKNRYIELSILENNYTIAPEVLTAQTDAIEKAIRDKVFHFSQMTTISTIREILFSSIKKLGYSEYQWKTQGDDRVRPSHAKMNGKWVNFDKPPEVTGYYHVMEDWGCRCWADAFR